MQQPLPQETFADNRELGKVFPMLDDLAEALKSLRKGSRMTQAQLADAIGVVPSSVTNVEVGRRQPSLDVLKDWLAACGATLRIEAPDATDPLSPVRTKLAAQSAARQALILEGLAALAELDDMKLPLLVGILQQQAKPAVVSEPEAHYAMGQRKGG